MPEGIPPRPGTPGYDDYVAHRQAVTEPAKRCRRAASGECRAGCLQPQPLNLRAMMTAAVKRGGLY